MLMRVFAGVILFVCAIGCGGGAGRPAAPSAPATAEPEGAPSEVAAVETARPPAEDGPRVEAQRPKEPEGPPPRERIRIENSCAKPVNLRIERNNDSDTNTSLTSNTSMEEHARDGDEIIIVDAKYAPIAKIVVTAEMKAVVIQSGCVTLGSK